MKRFEWSLLSSPNVCTCDNAEFAFAAYGSNALFPRANVYLGNFSVFLPSEFWRSHASHWDYPDIGRWQCRFRRYLPPFSVVEH